MTWSTGNKHRMAFSQKGKTELFAVFQTRSKAKAGLAHWHTSKNKLNVSNTDWISAFIYSFIAGPGSPLFNQKIPGKSTFCSWPYFNYLADALHLSTHLFLWVSLSWLPVGDTACLSSFIYLFTTPKMFLHKTRTENEWVRADLQ